MKIRIGFVSNNSSCSFVAIAIKTDNLSEEQDKKLSDDAEEDTESIRDFRFFDGGRFFGHLLVESNEEYLEEGGFTQWDLEVIIKYLREYLQKYGIDILPKLYTGARSC